MDPVIKTISQKVEVKCKLCTFEGEITTTRVYYSSCPECDQQIYVGHLTC